ncbi:MAG: hypothetical protein JKY34_13470 [Kordiimonadaceae bacterium]|nr:hypothetical protein [Kordiimonadaceae bacterium]
MARASSNETAISSGVDALITKLQQEGVAAGRSEAERIVDSAKIEAKLTLEKAKAASDLQVQTARKEAHSYRLAGEEALKTAMRDTILEMKTKLVDRFGMDLSRLVSKNLLDEEVLKKMILELVGRVGDETSVADENSLCMVLPSKVFGLEDLRKNPDELTKGPLTEFMLALTGEILREGIEFTSSDMVSAGILVKLEDGDVSLDFTDSAIASLLMEHLQPRFRAILEGIVK